jgi:hypothetical protein
MDRRPFASLTTVATAVKLLVLVAALVDLAAAVSSFRLLHLADEANQLGQSTLYYDAESIERTHALVRTLQLGVYAVGALVFVLWFRRAYTNLRAVSPEGTHRPSRLPVPLAWPTRLADHIWRESDPEPDAPEGKVPAFLGAWWRTFAVGAFLVVAGSLFWSSWVDGEAVLQLEVAALLQLVGNLLGVASAVLAYVVVDRTSKRQHECAAKLQLWRTATSP